MDLKSIRFEYFALGLMSMALLINSCDGAGSFYNPILGMSNSDQFIYFHTDGYYYLTREVGIDLYLYRSGSLSDWSFAERKLIHTKSGTGSDNPHAQPEILFLRGNWYIYYYSRDSALSQYHMFVITALNPENPFGGYSDEIRLAPAVPEEGFDEAEGTILEHNNGSLYFVYAGLANKNVGARKIFITPMSNPTTISGPRTLIRDSMTTWDTAVASPQILRQNKNGNQSFLVFTAISGGPNPAWVYCLGLMGIADGEDPLVAENWWHYPNGTVFASNAAANVHHPGYVSFTYSQDLTESWMAYSAVSLKDPVYTTRLDKIEWNEDGTPRFPTPTALTASLPLPSGEI